MFRIVVALALVALLSPGVVAQEIKVEVKKLETPPAVKKALPSEPSVTVPAPSGLPGEVEVSFLNGSTVRMILQSDKVEIDTPYGKLAVPSQEIRAIDFGLHFPDGAEPRIQQAIKSLGDSNFRARDQATKTLIELAPYSYPALADASKEGELEVSRRAKELIKQLQARHPKKDLKTSAEDRVITPTFTIVGRIQTPSLKAKAELFGNVELPVARMRGLRSLAGPTGTVEVTIDAAKYANAGQWLETEFVADGRSTMVVSAKGLVDTWPQQGGQYIVGPNGLQGRHMGMGAMVVVAGGRRIAGPIAGQMYGGMLVGKIGEDGEPFTIGERYEGTPEAEGKLYLHIGPSPWNTPSSGTYEVKITRKH